MMLLLHRSCNIDGEGGSGFGGNGPHGGANQNLNLQRSSLGSYFSLFFFLGYVPSFESHSFRDSLLLMKIFITYKIIEVPIK